MLDQPLYHVQDIEDASGGEERVRIRKVVDDLVEAGKKLGIEYRWAYSNISFELWLLLHVKDLTRHMNSARDYFTEMRLAFNRDWANIGQFKKEENFKSILSQYVTLESVTQAVRRAEAIRTRNQENAERDISRIQESQVLSCESCDRCGSACGPSVQTRRIGAVMPFPTPFTQTLQTDNLGQ